MACGFSELIRNARHEAGLTQAQLAEELNVSEKTIYYYSGGQKNAVPDGIRAQRAPMRG